MNPVFDIIKGRGAVHDPTNHFCKNTYVAEGSISVEDWETDVRKTQYLIESSKGVINKVKSPDLPMWFTVNPYQGCEHGCVYCYARNSHEYYGYSAGIDFEQKILVKKEAPRLFRQQLSKRSWKAQTISFSGNTDCYQPAERKFKLTRQMLQIALEFRQPVSIITKNSLILRDIDLLQEMAKYNLCGVFMSIPTMNESLRQKMEPRTATATQRLKVIERLSNLGVPMGVMTAPIIPGLNSQEIPSILKSATLAGVQHAGYTLVRLNGSLAEVFEEWLKTNFPDKYQKVWNGIKNCHGGKVSDTDFETRIHGTGQEAKLIKDVFRLHCKVNGLNKEAMFFDSSNFRVPSSQLSLF